MSSDPEPLRPHPLLTQYYPDEAARRRQVLRWFDTSAADYDWVSQALSFGSGNRYRRQALVRAGLIPGMQALLMGRGSGFLLYRIVEALVNYCFPMLHRLDEDRQKEIIDANIETLFEGLSQSMIDFYRKKLDETRPR